MGVGGDSFGRQNIYKA